MATSKVVCIEVTDAVTRVVEMDNGKKDPVIHKAVVFTTPDSTVSDGIVDVPDAFSKELANQLKNAGIHTKETIVTLSSNKVISREVTVPELKDDQISEFVQNQKTEYFPMDTSGHIMVHRVLERNKDTKQMRMIIFALPQRIVQNYQMVTAMAGLKLISLDYNGNSLFQWLSNDSHRDMSMYLQINERSSMFTITEKRKLAIQRNINFGAYALADRLLQSGYFEGDDVNGQGMTRSAAIKKLTDEEFIFPSFASSKLIAPDTEAAERLHSAKDMVTEGLRPLLGNLSRVMEYYHAKNKNAEINTIYIGGVGAKIKGLKNFLENEFAGVEIVVLDQLPDVKVSHAVERSGINTSELIACLGAVERSITFITVSEKEKTAKFIKITVIALAAVIIAAIVIVLLGKSEYDDAVKKKQKLDAEVKELEAVGIENLENQAAAARNQITEASSADDATYRYSEQWNETLASLEEKTVSSMVTNSVSVTNEGMSFSATVNSKEAAAKMIMQLKTVPYFASVTVNGIAESVDQNTGYSVVSFGVTITFRKYFDKDVNGDGVVDEFDDVNADGEINKYDIYGDYNGDGILDRRDIELGELDAKAAVMEIIGQDINRDGVVDIYDDYNGDKVVTFDDFAAFNLVEAGLAAAPEVLEGETLDPDGIPHPIETEAKEAGK